MFKGKLLVLLSAMSVGQEIAIDKERASVDAVFRELTELARQRPR
jgi:hypothetical protein